MAALPLFWSWGGDRSSDRLSRNQPGRADSAAIIALASNVDVAFVMAMQTTRSVLVLASARAWRASSPDVQAPHVEHREARPKGATARTAFVTLLRVVRRL